jgi:hypothetical protein
MNSNSLFAENEKAGLRLMNGAKATTPAKAPLKPREDETDVLFREIGEAEVPTPAQLERLHYLAGEARRTDGLGGVTNYWRRFFDRENECHGRSFDQCCARYSLTPGPQIGGLIKATFEAQAAILAVQEEADHRREEIAASVEACRRLEYAMGQATERVAQAKRQVSECEARAAYVSESIPRVEESLPTLWLEGSFAHFSIWAQETADAYNLLAGLRLAAKDSAKHLKAAKDAVAAAESNLTEARRAFEDAVATLAKSN